ncbi:MAG: hypothetical protein JST75_17260 [Bacteroidetes bacterium]|nr:hypothetical protein [Bacteroidota bacterium]
MKKVFVTYLGSANFLPGILVLRHTLKIHNPSAGLIVLVVRNIPADILSFLRDHAFPIKIIDEIENPYLLESDERGFKCMFTKLRVFELTEYDKIVYLDADMLVCENIESLFDKPHMSAVNAGALIPENSNWEKLNAGLMVVEPDKELFKKMASLIDVLPSEAKEDQGFLHSYYPLWPSQHELHLEHKFNIPAPYIDQYCNLPGFKFSFTDQNLSIENIAVIHYWGAIKPWNYDDEDINQIVETKYGQSLQLWWHYFYEATENF